MGHTYPLFWVFAILCVLLFYIRHKKRIQTFLLGSFTGLLSLVLLHLFGDTIGYTPTLSLTNLALAVLLGIPGTALAALPVIFS